MPARRRNITPKKEHDDWMKDNAISLSRFVHLKIDEGG